MGLQNQEMKTRRITSELWEPLPHGARRVVLQDSSVTKEWKANEHLGRRYNVRVAFLRGRSLDLQEGGQESDRYDGVR